MCYQCSKSTFNSWKTVGHIRRKIYRHFYYFIKTEIGFANGSVISAKYRPSPIPSGRLEILLLLKFSCRRQNIYEKMKTLLILLMITITVDLASKKAVMKKKLQLSLKPISSNQSVTPRLISQNWSVTLTVVLEKKRPSTSMIILMNQLTCPLINFPLI